MENCFLLAVRPHCLPCCWAAVPGGGWKGVLPTEPCFSLIPLALPHPCSSTLVLQVSAVLLGTLSSAV